MVTLITGGIKSGKSSFALSLGEGYKNRLFIATAEPFDDDMKKKIDLHKMERGDGWTTIEEPLNLTNALKDSEHYDFIIIDCLTMWVNNILYHKVDIDIYINDFLKYLKRGLNSELVLVTNEVGLGIIPIDSVVREYVNLLGQVNQKLAHLSERVILMVSGLPFYIKGQNHELQAF
ncbi:MAG: bifunctional adenosylcobinamide kinase/adenosylcobinamide-phosphate guanylyltransferase [Calditerrivibrio sp.]|nr:bifunctional adenosylcobinamide kinase/adenosylcobinamide-phosphate guanylyltransferase [Calditerrivibrio sp.]